MERIVTYIKELSRINGTSGDEQDVAAYLYKHFPSDCDVKTDNLGNITVFKEGKERPGKKVMLAAHMDEVGFIITSITSDGLLTFNTVGGIIPSVVFGRQVRLKSGVTGVIGAKAWHNLTTEERETQPKIENLYIDIGATSKEQAETYVSLGDNGYFTGEVVEFGDGYLKGKALDDRVGCAILLDLLQQDLPYDCTFVFTVQEEVGTRGAATAAYTLKPDIALVVETTTACDIGEVENEKRVCELGKGCVVSFMDKGTVYDKALYHLAFETAKELNIPCQTKTMVAGGNDSSAIHKSAGGIRTAALSVPTRYLHSPACVMKKEDIKATADLVKAMLIRSAQL